MLPAMSLIEKADLQRYIDDETEESLVLDYKGAAALGKSHEKKKEITKDVSAMANSAGGRIIYGIREFQQDAKKHLPEKLDPIDRSDFSKEWLEQVTSNIRPRINGLVIHPVSFGPAHVAYIVDIPQSTTAHQATDHRYYKRYNFQSVPMEDHEIRDVMNRGTTPVLEVDTQFAVTEPITGVSPRSFQLTVDFFLLNKGDTLARFPCLTFYPPIGLKFEERRVLEGLLPIVTRPEGAWRRLAGGADSVLYPGDLFRILHIPMKLLRLHLSQPDVRIGYAFVAEGTKPQKGEFFLSGSDLEAEVARKALDAWEEAQLRRGLSGDG